jgi:hypothetical protein
MRALASLLLAPALVVACVTSPRTAEMMPGEVDAEWCHPVAVEVRSASLGYSIRDATGGGRIAPSAFLEAVRRAVEQSRIFRSAAAERSPHRLEAAVFDVEPANVAGIPSVLVVSAHWRLVAPDGAVVYDDIVRTAYSPGRLGGTRAAKEGAVRDNIREGIRRLGQLRLPEEGRRRRCRGIEPAAGSLSPARGVSPG